MRKIEETGPLIVTAKERQTSSPQAAIVLIESQIGIQVFTIIGGTFLYLEFWV